jgi:hypothetical protein
MSAAKYVRRKAHLSATKEAIFQKRGREDKDGMGYDA